MADNSIYKVHQMINRVGFEFDDKDAKRIVELSTEAAQLAADNMIEKLSKVAEEFGNILNDAFEKMGKPRMIDLSKVIKFRGLDAFDELGNQLKNSLIGGAKAGVAEVLNELKKLEQQRSPKIDRKKEIKSRISNFQSVTNIREDQKHRHQNPYEKGKDIVETARKVYNSFEEAKEILMEVSAGYGDDAEYEKALDKFYKATNDMYRMRETIRKNKKEFTDKNLMSKFKYDNLNDAVDEAFEKADTSLRDYITTRTNEYEVELQEIRTDLEEINDKIINIRKNNKDFIDKDTLKSIKEVEDAYDRILNKSGKKDVNKWTKRDIESAVNYDPSSDKTTLGALHEKLESARSRGAGWEEEYQWLVKFVDKYEYLRRIQSKDAFEYTKREFGKYYDLERDRSVDARTSLNNLLLKADNKPITNVKETVADMQDLEEGTRDVIEVKQNEAVVHQENAGAIKEETEAIKEEISAMDALIKKAGQYKDFKKFERENMKDLIAVGVRSHEESGEIWKQGRMLNFKPAELTKEDAVEILREKVPDNILDGWFRNADSGYKTKIEELALSDDDIRNAALNIMWDNYKNSTGKEIGFEEFLHSDIPMYRGKNSEKYVKGDETLGFTFDPKVAEKFGKHVLETVIKPIETLGAYQTTGESEALVYRKPLEDRPEYQQWHDAMAGKVVEANVDAVEKDTVATEDLTKAKQEAVEKVKKITTDSFDAEFRDKMDMGTSVEASGRVDLETMEVDRFTINEPGKGKLVNDESDYSSVFKGGKKGSDYASIHSHPSRVAVPSAMPLGSKQGDLNAYFERRDWQPLHIIRGMEEDLLLDFSKISEASFKELINEWAQVSDQIEKEWGEIPFAERKSKYGSLGEYEESRQAALKDAFLKIIPKYDVGTTYTKNPMFPGQTSTQDLDFKYPKHISQLDADAIVTTTDVELLKTYIDEYRKLLNYERLSTKDMTVRDRLYGVLNPDYDEELDNKIDNSDNKYDSLSLAKEMLGKQTKEEITVTNDAVKATKEATAAQEEYNQKKKEATEIPVPSEEDIKSGKASWRGMPIKYNASLPNEAQNLTDHMEVGSKFFEAQNQDNILDHEVAHNIADRLMQYMTGTWEKASEIFMSNGEGLYGDLGASALSETLAHAVTEYFSDPDALKARSEGAFNYIEEYLKKSGDTLDNVYGKLGEAPIEPESDTVVADNEKKIKSYEELKGVLQEYHDAIVNAKNAEGDQKQPHVERYMDLNNLLLEQLEDDDQRSQLMGKLKDVSKAGVDEESIRSIAQMFGIDIPKAAKKAEAAISDVNEELKETSSETKKASTRIFDLYLAAAYPLTHENELETALQDNPNLIAELTAERDALKAKLQPVNDTAKRISKNASINGLHSDQLKQEAANVAKQLSTMYDEGIRDTEEYVTLQYKLLNIFKELEHVYGGLKGSSASNHTEFRRWIADSVEQATGFNPMTDQVVDALWGQREFSIMKTNEQPFKMREMAGKLNNGGFAELDYQKLSELNVVIDALNKIPQAAETAEQSVDELTASLEKQQQVEQKSENEVVETQAETAAQAELNEELKETADLKSKIEAIGDGGVHGQSVADVDDKVKTPAQPVDVIPEKEVTDVDVLRQKIVDVTEAVKAKTAAFKEEAAEVQRVVDAEIEDLNRLDEKIDKIRNNIAELVGNIKSGESGNIVVNVNAETQQNDGALNDIKTAVESINKKIVQGTKVIKTGDKKEAEEKSKKPEIKKATDDGYVKATKVNPKVKDLRALYEEQAALEVKQELNNQEAVKIRLKQIEDDILDLKKDGVALDEQEIKNIKEKVKHNERNRLAVEQAEEAAKQKTKDDKAALRAEMKAIRDQSRIAKADSTWRSGKDVYGLSMNMVDESNGITLDDVIDHKEMQKLRQELDLLTQARKKVDDQIKAGKEVKEADIINLQKQTAATKQQTDAVKELMKNYEFFSGDNSASLNQTYTGGDLESQLKQAIILATNGKAKFIEYDTTLKRWTYTVNGANNEVKHFTAGLRETDQQLRTVHTTTKKTESMFEAIKRKVKEVFTYFSGSSIIYKAFDQLKKGIQYIKEIDAALVELRKVTDETEETYDRFLKTAAKTADRLGSTISQVTEATATFAKLGYSMEMASEMAEAAIVYKNVGDNIASTEDAADSIISTMKGFRLEASESMRIVDSFNEVGNRFAITSQGLGEALRLSASALNEGGNTLHESIGIITAANEVVNDPSSVGKK